MIFFPVSWKTPGETVIFLVLLQFSWIFAEINSVLQKNPYRLANRAFDLQLFLTYTQLQKVFLMTFAGRFRVSLDKAEKSGDFHGGVDSFYCKYDRVHLISFVSITMEET